MLKSCGALRSLQVRQYFKESIERKPRKEVTVVTYFFLLQSRQFDACHISAQLYVYRHYTGLFLDLTLFVVGRHNQTKL